MSDATAAQLREARNPTALPRDGEGWLLDSHVHFYPCFDIDDFLQGAISNLTAAAAGLHLGWRARGCLVLTESAEHRYFRALYSGAVAPVRGKYLIERTREPSSLLVTDRGEAKLVIISGRQIRSRENLEVLALGCDVDIPDGLPLEEALTSAERHAAAVVLPWGVGKWRFSRGRIVARVLEEWRPSLFVGDNGNRPRMIPTPRLLRSAAAQGRGVLPGSDPLPLPSHGRRAGRSGVYLPCMPDVSAPMKQIATLLLERTTNLQRFDESEPLPRFLRSQLLMQLRKHARFTGGRPGNPSPHGA